MLVGEGMFDLIRGLSTPELGGFLLLVITKAWTDTVLPPFSRGGKEVNSLSNITQNNKQSEHTSASVELKAAPTRRQKQARMGKQKYTLWRQTEGGRR